MQGLMDKRVLSTGGASGIGKAAATRFVEEGSRVAVLDRNEAGLAALAPELPGLEARLLADVSSIEEVTAAYEQLDALWGGLDVLINNAGISLRHDVMEITPEEGRAVLDTNLTGLFFVGQAAARRMLATERSGVIVNMGSMNGLVGCRYYADDNASKAGVIELTRTLALELVPRVRVVEVCPGAVRTPMQEAEYTPTMFAELDERIPLPRRARPARLSPPAASP